MGTNPCYDIDNYYTQLWIWSQTVIQVGRVHWAAWLGAAPPDEIDGDDIDDFPPLPWTLIM